MRPIPFHLKDPVNQDRLEFCLVFWVSAFLLGICQVPAFAKATVRQASLAYGQFPVFCFFPGFLGSLEERIFLAPLRWDFLTALHI
jgi:hypothetical protein